MDHTVVMMELCRLLKANEFQSLDDVLFWAEKVAVCSDFEQLSSISRRKQQCNTGIMTSKGALM